MSSISSPSSANLFSVPVETRSSPIIRVSTLVCVFLLRIFLHSAVVFSVTEPIGLYRENAIAIESEARDPFGGNVCYVTMQITFPLPEFARKERNLHCDVVHVTTMGRSRDRSDPDVAIKAYCHCVVTSNVDVVYDVTSVTMLDSS